MYGLLIAQPYNIRVHEGVFRRYFPYFPAIFTRASGFPQRAKQPGCNDTPLYPSTLPTVQHNGLLTSGYRPIPHFSKDPLYSITNETLHVLSNSMHQCGRIESSLSQHRATNSTGAACTRYRSNGFEVNLVSPLSKQQGTNKTAIEICSHRCNPRILVVLWRPQSQKRIDTR